MTPYERIVTIDDSAGSGATVVPVSVADRVLLSKLIVSQVSGTPGNLTVKLFNNATAAAGTGVADPATGLTIPVANFLIAPVLTSTAGPVEAFSLTLGTAALFSQDSLNNNGSDGQSGIVYVQITSASGDRKYAVTVGTIDDKQGS